MKFNGYIDKKDKRKLELYGIINVLEKFCMPFLNHMKRVGLKDWFYRGSKTRLNSKKIVKVKPRKDRMPMDMDAEMQEYMDDLFYNKFKWRPRTEGIFTTSKRDATLHYGTPGIFLPIGKKYEFVYNPDIQDLYSTIDDYNLYPPDRDIIRERLEDTWSMEDNYEDEYGKGSGGGSWYYDDEDTMETDWYDAKRQVIHDMISSGDIDPDDEDIDLMVDDSLFNWVPMMSWNEYMDEKIDEKYNEITSEINEYIYGYTNKNLRKASSSEVEVTFKCKEYFLVGTKFDHELGAHFLDGNPMKPDFWQKKFDFEQDHMFKFATISE